MVSYILHVCSRLVSGSHGDGDTGRRSCDQRVQDCVEWLVAAEAANRPDRDDVISLTQPSYHPFYGELPEHRMKDRESMQERTKKVSILHKNLIHDPHFHALTYM